MPSSAADKSIMTLGDAADDLELTERTIYRQAGTKQIPAFKAGESRRLSRADFINSWFKQQSTTFGQPKAKA